MNAPVGKSFVVALDGPAASGKGTLARAIAAHYGFAHLDTGLLYRGVAWRLLNAGRDPRDEAAAAAAARAFTLEGLDDRALRARIVGPAASVVAANPAVRAALYDFQRAFAENPPDAGGAGGARPRGAVLDGRDIGTVVYPEAPLKFFVTADPEARAHRRWLEQRRENPALTEAAVLAEIRERDARDSSRAEAPLRQAEDAELLNTTYLTIEAAFAVARRMIDSALARWPSGNIP